MLIDRSHCIYRFIQVARNCTVFIKNIASVNFDSRHKNAAFLMGYPLVHEENTLKP